MQSETKRKCTAKCKQSGKPCKSYAMIGKNVCRMHGGTSTGPPLESQNAKVHGGYSKFLDADDIAAGEAEAAEIDTIESYLISNAIMRARGFKLSKDPNPEVRLIGSEFIQNAIKRAPKLKLTRLDLKNAASSEDNKPLPYDSNDLDD